MMKDGRDGRKDATSVDSRDRVAAAEAAAAAAAAGTVVDPDRVREL